MWTTGFSRAALYAGGFLGPFGAGVTTSMLPELGGAFGVGAEDVANSVTAYLTGFAVVMLVSGHLAERWGPRRAVAVAYVAYAVFSIAAAFAPTTAGFFTFRTCQGIANGFISPILLAQLAKSVVPERQARAISYFAGLQAAGQVLAPLAGGLAAAVSWRLPFFALAALAVLLAVAGLPKTESGAAGPRPSWGSAFRSASLLRTLGIAFVTSGFLGGLSFLITLRADSTFDLGSIERGLLLAGFGVAGIVIARPAAVVIRQRGAARCLHVSTVAGALTVIAAGVVPSAVAMAAAWLLAGALNQVMLVALNSSAMTILRPDHLDALSVIQSARMISQAVAPVLFIPVYLWSEATGFILPAVVTLVAAFVLTRRPFRAVGEEIADGQNRITQR